MRNIYLKLTHSLFACFVFFSFLSVCTACSFVFVVVALVVVGFFLSFYLMLINYVCRNVNYVLLVFNNTFYLFA